MVKVWQFTGSDIEDARSTAYATEEYIERNKLQRVPGSEIEVGSEEIDGEGRYVPKV